MRVALRLVPLLLLLAGLAGPASAAIPRYESESFFYDVKISGSHTVDWAYASRLDRPNCTTWSAGKGRFEAIFTTTKTARYELVEVRRDGELVEMRWGALRDRLPKFTISQTGAWQSNNGFKTECTPCGPLSEFGPCVPDPPAPPKPSCPKRTAAGVIDSTIYRRASDMPKDVDDLGQIRGGGPRLVIEARYSEDAKHADRCYPGAGGESLPLTQPAAVVVTAHRLVRLDRGKSVELKDVRPEWVRSGKLQDQAQCGELDGVLEMNACGLTKVKIAARRVR